MDRHLVDAIAVDAMVVLLVVESTLVDQADKQQGDGGDADTKHHG